MLYKMIFWPENAEDISSVYLLNQIFESISDLDIKNDMTPTYIIVCVCVCVYLPVLLINLKLKIKKN